MGRFRGKRIPDQYNPFWEEDDYKDQPDHWHWWHLGHEDGYQDGYEKGFNDKIKQENLEGQIESLKALLAANVRVIKAELAKEYEQSNRVPEQELQTVGNPAKDG